jgi:NDP-sugar pyrophosphorylase family protein
MLPMAILAGGLGSRLRPLTNDLPKCLVEINGEPFLAHQLRLLRSRGVSHVVLCLGYRGDMVREFLGNGQRFGLTVDYSFDGSSLRGTAGSVCHAIPMLGEAFFVLYGDSYLTCDYAAVESAFRASGKPALMTVFRNVGRWDASNVEFEGDRILAYDKTVRTDRMRHIDYGLGLFHSRVFQEPASETISDLAALYQTLLARDELAAFEVRERFFEIGSFQGVQDLSEALKS